MTVVVHAMICVTMRYLELDDIRLEESERDLQVRSSRDAVTRIAMTSMSVESLQALVILASDYVRNIMPIIDYANCRNDRWLEVICPVHGLLLVL